MRTLITISIEHKDPIPDLAEKIANRAHTIQHVVSAEVHGQANSVDLIALPVIEMPEEVAR